MCSWLTFRAVVLKLYHAWEPQRELFKHKLPGPTPDSDSVGLDWNPRLHCNQVPGDVDAVAQGPLFESTGLGTMLGRHWL
jgi:hypothetical protein